MKDRLRELLMGALMDDSEPFDVLVVTVRDELAIDLESATRSALSTLEVLEREGMVEALWYENWEEGPRAPTSHERQSVLEDPSALLLPTPSQLWFDLTAAHREALPNPPSESQWRLEASTSEVKVVAASEELARRVLGEYLVTHRLELAGDIKLEKPVELQLRRGTPIAGSAVQCSVRPAGPTS